MTTSTTYSAHPIYSRLWRQSASESINSWRSTCTATISQEMTAMRSITHQRGWDIITVGTQGACSLLLQRTYLYGSKERLPNRGHPENTTTKESSDQPRRVPS